MPAGNWKLGVPLCKLSMALLLSLPPTYFPNFSILPGSEMHFHPPPEFRGHHLMVLRDLQGQARDVYVDKCSTRILLLMSSVIAVHPTLASGWQERSISTTYADVVELNLISEMLYIVLPRPMESAG